MPKDLLSVQPTSAAPRDLLSTGPKDLLASGPKDLLEPEAVIREYKPTISSRVRDWMLGFKVGKESIPPLEIPKRILFQKEEGATEVARQAGANFINSYLFGVPRAAAKKLGIEEHMPEPETTAEQIGAGVGSLAGFVEGPLKAAGSIAPKLPIVGRAFTPATTAFQSVIKPLARSGTVLGTAEALSSITEPSKIPQEFGRGAKTGAVFGGISFIPSRPLRMILSSAYTGVPSTLRNEPLENQIFNYGLGAYFGLKGGKTPRQILKTEQPLAQFMTKGVEGKDLSQTFHATDNMLNQLERTVRETGVEPITRARRLEMVLRSGGKVHYQPVIPEKAWRNNTIKSIWTRMKAIKQRPEYTLRDDDVSFAINEISTKKNLSKMDNASLFNLETILNRELTPVSTNIFSDRPIVKREVERGKHLNIWDATLRPGFKLLEKLGFGGIQKGGLTNEFFDSDVNQAKFLNQHIDIVNNFQKTVGFKRETSRKIFKYLDGRLHERLLSSKELQTAKQMRRYLDLQLEYINRYRAQYGEPPVKPRENYITHIFDDFKQELISKKYPFPEYLESITRFITPKEKRSPFLLQRKGAKGYVEDIWKALDAYSYRTSGVVNDQPIRRANKVIRFIQKEIRLNEKIGKRSPIDWVGIKKNLDSYTRDYVGRPGELDRALRNTMDIFNRRLPAGMQIRSIMDLTNTFNSLVYGASMGFRPKLAIRNLGQHSLTFGEVGTKPLVKAITTPNNDTTREIISHSKVLSTRKLHFAPEIQPAFSGRVKGQLSKSAFWLYRGADYINVRNAFLAGYYEAKGQGKPDAAAYQRGDEVAAKTQYLYLKGNRSSLARGTVGGRISPAFGRTAGVFTTWPANWLELQLAWAKPEHRHKLLRYIGLNVGLLATGTATGIQAWKYTGIESPLGVFNMLKGKLPITGVTERPPIPPQIFKDIEKAVEEEDLKELFFYTWEKE